MTIKIILTKIISLKQYKIFNHLQLRKSFSLSTAYSSTSHNATDWSLSQPGNSFTGSPL